MISFMVSAVRDAKSLRTRLDIHQILDRVTKDVFSSQSLNCVLLLFR